MRFDVGSNSSSASPSDLPSDSLTGQLTCRGILPAVTLSQQITQILITGRFDIESNSSSEYFSSDYLTEQLISRTTLPAATLSATRPELCHWAVRHREQLLHPLMVKRLFHGATYFPRKSVSRDSPSHLPRALSLGGSTEGATLPATACRATISRRTTISWSNLFPEQIGQRLLAERLSHGAAYFPSKSVSDYLPSDSLTEQFISRATRSVETLPATTQELCHWAVRRREKLLQRLLAERLSLSPSQLPAE
jgi:hypothetical protein